MSLGIREIPRIDMGAFIKSYFPSIKDTRYRASRQKHGAWLGIAFKDAQGAQYETYTSELRSGVYLAVVGGKQRRFHSPESLVSFLREAMN